MGGVRLLAGEKEELRLRPSPAGWWPYYLGALWFAAVGGIVYGLSFLPTLAAPIVLAVIAAGLLVCAGFLQQHRRKRNDHLALAMLVALAVGAVGAFVVPAIAQQRVADPTDADRAAIAAWLLPCALLAAAVLGLVWAELRRLTTSIHVTNVRTVLTTAIPHREHALHHADLADIDRQRAGAGGGMHLTLVPRQGEPLRLRGVPDAEAVANLVSLLAQRTTATDYLRKSQDLDARIVDAIAAFHRR